MNTYNKKGVVTIELLVAFAISITMLSSAIVIAFSGQTGGLDTNLSNHGLYKSKTNMGSTTAAVIALWDNAQSSEEFDKPYTNISTISDITPCLKYITEKIVWDSEKNRQLGVSLGTFVANTKEAQALDDCDPIPPGSGWLDTPNAYPFADPIFSGSEATDVDVIKRSSSRFALLTAHHNPSPGGNTLWMVDVSDIDADPVPYGFYSTPDDLLAVDAIGDYAFAVGATSSSQKPLNIFDITDISNIALVAETELPNTNAADFEGARSVYYYNHKIYVGTNYMAFGSPTHNEFFIFDVTNPYNPIFEKSINVNRNVNDIVVRDGLAYLATGPGNDNTVMKIYDVDAASPTYGMLIGEYAAPTAQAGTAIDLLGNYIYLGRDRPNGSGTRESLFVVIDISNPALPTVTDETDLMISKGTYIAGIQVRGHLAFLVTSDQNSNNQSGNAGDGPFIIYDVSDPADIALVTFCSSLNWSEKSTGLDISDDIVFVSNASNDALQVILPTYVCTP